MLEGRRVLLAVTGGVAAYKSAILARRLEEAGAETRVLLTESALQFVGTQTFAAITGFPPYTSLFGETSVSPHTELARWCDIAVVAPATAATIGRVAHGISSDLVSSTILATQRPVLFAPAMHTEMWEHPATQRNVAILHDDGYHLVGPASGALAGGDEGIGRVAEPEEILDVITAILTPVEEAMRVLVTAGGTREPIDPVRFLGNRSSGKMGHAIADEASRRGLRVTLVTTSDLPTLGSVDVMRVETAQQMLDSVSKVPTDIAIMAAAVADFRPKESASAKIPRSDGLDAIELAPTPDVLKSVVERQPKPYVVGFAAETGGVQRAVEKAARKSVDLMVYNDVMQADSGFGTDTNRVTFIDSRGEIDDLPLLSKAQVAKRLLDRVIADTTAGG